MPRLVVLVIFLLWGGVAIWGVSEKQRIISARQSELAKLTLAVEEQTLRLFKLTEASIQAAASWIEDHPESFPASDPGFVKLVTELRRVSDNALVFRLIDPDGNLFSVPATSHQPVANVGDNEDIRIQRQPATRGLYISDPLKSRVTESWIVPVTFPVLNATGELRFIVAAVFELDEIARIFDSQRDKPNGSITILKADGVTLFRTPAIEGAIGRSIAKAPDFVEHLSARSRGQYRVKGAFDGVDRLISHARLTHYPLIVAVTTSIDDALSPWRHETYRAFAIVAVLTLIAIFLGRRFYRIEYESRRRLAESELRFRSLIENAPDAILVLDPAADRVIDANPQAAVLFQHTRAEILKLNLGTIFATVRMGARAGSESTESLIERALKGESLVAEARISRPDDADRMVEVRLSAMHEGSRSLVRASFSDVTERKESEEKIYQLAYYDPLTELPNRRLFGDRLQQALVSCTRRNTQGALMLLDLDNFKTLNDTFGHDLGDRFLIAVTKRLLAAVRTCDTVARLGGDEFVLIISDLGANGFGAAQAERIASNVMSALSQPHTFERRAGSHEVSHVYHCTCSIGITLFFDQSVSVEELMKRADTAMYQAKAAGRNTVRFFDPKMQAALAQRAVLEIDLRNGLSEGQFVLFYQPQVDSARRLIGVEALVRWQHPERGLVPPNEFIPFAEETGLILELGRWVLEAACMQSVEWADLPERASLVIAVNVSTRQFRHRDFVEQVLSILDATGADPHKLKLEITESLLLDDIDGAISKMHQLKSRGVTFAIDDFGTGYSSLSYLKRLPLDQLKIDQSFVRDVLTDPNDAAIARAIITLAQSMGLSVIAEGVETAEQRDFLGLSGCHTYQGYFFGRPGPAHSLTCDFSDAS